MSEKQQKIRLYQYASEIKISTDVIIAYLDDKGFGRKTNMTPLSDVMLDLLEEKFKKEKSDAKKHQKKIDDFQKNYQHKNFQKEEKKDVREESKVAEVQQVEVKVEQEKVEEITKPQVETKKEEPHVGLKVVGKIDLREFEEKKARFEKQEKKYEHHPKEFHQHQQKNVQNHHKNEHKIVPPKHDSNKVQEKKEVLKEEIKKVEVFEPIIPQIEPVIEVVNEIGEPKKYVTASEKELNEREVGLKVLGKINLEDRNKKRPKKKKFRDDKDGSTNNNQNRTPSQSQPREQHRRPQHGPSQGGEGQGQSQPHKHHGTRPPFHKPKPVAEDTKTIDPKPKDLVVVPKGSDDNSPKKKLKVKKRKEDETDSSPNKKKKKVKKFEIDKQEVQDTIRKTMLAMDEESSVVDRASFRKKKKKEKAIIQERIMEQMELDKSIIKVTEFIAVNELANLMNVSVSEVIQKCISLGLMVSINQRLDFETITIVADEFDFQVEMQEELHEDTLVDTNDPISSLEWRPPVVTIMGHVDHGKTSLLDYIRQTNVVAGESGGITQHIGAYHVEVRGKFITFLDTPGHEAFTAMRARGAQVTDIVILIVAADDSVMPQTIEAINHAQAANVPMIVAINKIDKPGSNIDKIKQQLADRGVLVEEWGGKYQSIEISAKKGLNIDDLLDKILVEAEMLDLKANYNRKARGSIIEAQLEKGRGVVATVLVQKGTLQVGDPFVAGNNFGRVRAMFDERNNKVKSVGPSVPVVVTGFEGVPQAGDQFIIVNSEKEAHEIALKRQQIKREQDQRQVHMITLDEVASQISKGQIQDLNIVVKGDVDGSVEALADSFMKLSNEEVRVKVIHKGVGAISESDVLLAAASRAIIVGFHVRPHLAARKLAETEKVEIRLYNIIYDAIEELKSALEGMLRPLISEEVVATIEVRDTFKVPKVGTIAGCFVVDGKINRNDRIRLFRDGISIYEGSLSTLKRYKDDVRDVEQGYECGLNINNFNDIKIGDTIEAYKIVETKQKLK